MFSHRKGEVSSLEMARSREMGSPGVGGMGASLDSVQQICQGFSYSIMVLDNKQIGAERIPLLLGGKKSQHIYKMTARHRPIIPALSRLRQVDQNIQG